MVFTSSYGASGELNAPALRTTVPGTDGSRSAETPMLRTSLSMVDTSCRPGTFSSETVSAVSSAAHSSGKAAFFAPEIVTVPFSALPPLMRILSMALTWEVNLSVSRPLCGRKSFHRQRMHFVGLNAAAQGCIHRLVALNRALALKGAGHNRRVPMLAVARQLNVLTRQAAGNDGSEFFAGHMGKWISF